jgi:hypothetical protein
MFTIASFLFAAIVYTQPICTVHQIIPQDTVQLTCSYEMKCTEADKFAPRYGDQHYDGIVVCQEHSRFIIR